MALLAPTQAPLAASDAQAQARMATRPERGKPLVVGLLHNVKPNGDVIIRQGYELLAAEGLATEFVFRNKPNTAQPASEEAVEALARCDVVLTALSNCGSCTSFSVQDAVRLERMGVPTVLFVTDAFIHMARRVAEGLQFPMRSLKIVQVPHAITMAPHEGAVEMVNAVADDFFAAVFDPAQSPTETGADPAPAARSGEPAGQAAVGAFALERIDIDPADAEAVMDAYRERGWIDGLPIVPPTEERVARMLGDWPADEVLGVVPPGRGVLTLQSLAVNAVMAGCAPSYFPVVVGAARAVLKPEFQLLGVNATTAAATPLLIVNGPIAREIGIQGGGDVLGAYHRANVTIGRAIRLTMIGVGNARPQDGDMATHGQSAKVGLCITENIDDSPWESFSVERGWDPGANTIAAISITAQFNMVDFASRTALDLLKQLSRTIATPGMQNVQTQGGGPVLLLGPTRANMLAAAGFSKYDVKRWLYLHARVPMAGFSAGTIEDVLMIRRPWTVDHDPDARVPIVDDLNDIHILVAGAVGAHSFLMPTFAATRPVFQEIFVAP